MKKIDKILDFFKVLSDETRLRIMILLHERKLCVCEICDILEISQPKASRHLTKLRDMGFVLDERQGQWIFYSLTLKNESMENILLEIRNNIKQYPVLVTDLEKINRNITNYCELRGRYL
ncbi:MAG: metalloregulator ArsR/SmtB family transcription factor [Terrisporobacter sp.]